jgi:hypothetical protein
MLLYNDFPLFFPVLIPLLYHFAWFVFQMRTISLRRSMHKTLPPSLKRDFALQFIYSLKYLILLLYLKNEKTHYSVVLLAFFLSIVINVFSFYKIKYIEDPLIINFYLFSNLAEELMKLSVDILVIIGTINYA